MPQMAPLNWLGLYLGFSALYVVVGVKIFFIKYG
nr:ATP synthase F0 subunit 8 [Lamproglena chinensis]WKF18924.1 ATP synthase F0 subunit 8 [Lamproglena chinensis]